MALTKQSSKEEIKAFQHNLEALGFPLPRFGADGILGQEVRSATLDAVEAYSLPSPGADVYSTELVSGLAARVDALARFAPNKHTPGQFNDLTAIAYPGPRRQRVPWKTWTGVTIHQTGSPIGNQTWPPTQLHQRWSHTTYTNEKGVVVHDSLHAHIGITRGGEVLLVHPLDFLVWHGNRLSTFQWGVEIECFARGVENDPATLPSGGFPHLEANDLQIQRAREVLSWLNLVAKSQTGRELRTINPHRNAMGDRRADPGERLYREVVLWGMDRMGLTDGGSGYKLGTGIATPTAWNPAYAGIGY